MGSKRWFFKGKLLALCWCSALSRRNRYANSRNTMHWQSDTAVMFTGPENDPMNRVAGCTERVPVAGQTGAFCLSPWRLMLTNDEMNSPLFFVWRPVATSPLGFLTGQSQPKASNLVWGNFFQLF
ncbi:MAG: hypothetical protein VW984_03885, partial [Halieaceae bacterium]